MNQTGSTTMATDSPDSRSKPAGGSAPAYHSSGPPPLPKQRGGGAAASPGPKVPRRERYKIEAADRDRPSLFSRETLRSSLAFLVSMVTHMLILITLALWFVPEPEPVVLLPLVVEQLDDISDELETLVLDERTDPATTLEYVESGGLAGSEREDISNPQMDREVLEQDETAREFGIEDPLDYSLGRGEIISAVPDGTLGTARSIADNYQKAIDQITQELLWLLAKQKVLVIWCFDQSGSMKDDQKEIRDRIERVYTELGLSDSAAGDALATAVTSYGEKLMVHTDRPTSKLDVIRRAIDSVPTDKSGKEIMCEAVGRAIAGHRNYATKGHRRLVLVLVTDESGEPENNVQYLERTIEEAKAARCIVYILGREAVFGYPYARIRWVHPQTGRPHWIPIHRGPETAFPEQLQTNGFHRRWDAHPSGFGPYAQSRLAHQTGGTFFMLPSIESNLVRGEKRRYELEAMQAYRPDLRSALEIFNDRDRSKLRTLVWGIISDLDPYNQQSAKVIEMRIHFSPRYDEFVHQVPPEHQKAKVFMDYLDKAIAWMEKNKKLREDEASHRWQGNYDLIYAQLVAYRARLVEYVAYTGAFVKTPKVVPLSKPLKSTTVYLTHWDVGTRKKMLKGDELAPLVEKATALLKEVIKNHPGTPWAARAQWELNRGFGVELYPYYEPKYKDVKNPIPVPKL